MSRRVQRRQSSGSTLAVVVVLVAVLFLMIGLCCGAFALLRSLSGDEEIVTPSSEPALVVAYSPEKEQAFLSLVDGFNQQDLQTSDGEPMRVETVQLDPEAMVNTVLGGGATFQALTPDSSVWLGQLDEEWSAQRGSEAVAVGETVRYAISPVVIAMWESLAREMGWPQQALSWQDLLNRAQNDPDFRWSHPSTSSASGLLATLAEFYAGAGKTRGLTIDDVQAQETLDYVAALERTVRYYGEGDERAIIDRALAEGRDFLDAFVVQEQMVTYFNTNRGGQERLVALYPVEGALWEDHPLALLETSELTPYQRQVFAQFRDYVLSSEAQQLILSHGYRPADLALPLDGPGSPLTGDNGVDASEPKTALQVPNASVIRVVRDVWWYTKRHANIYLVVDVSGSMRGDKLAQAQEALHIFLDQIKGDQERVGLIEFETEVRTTVRLDDLGSNRAALQLAVNNLVAAGDTALLDGVAVANQQLGTLGDTERINAIVVMTDGKENASNINLRRLVRNLTQESAVETLVFCIAYGDDADMLTLRAIAEPSGGAVFRGDLETIRELYKILSTYF